jgi:hypothetical protein
MLDHLFTSLKAKLYFFDTLEEVVGLIGVRSFDETVTDASILPVPLLKLTSFSYYGKKSGRSASCAR